MYLKKFQVMQILDGYMKMDINNFDELMKYLDKLSTYKRATLYNLNATTKLLHFRNFNVLFQMF